MSLVRSHDPGLGTLLVHGLVILLLALLLAPILALRFLIAPVAELLIRASDNLHDALVERLNR